MTESQARTVAGAEGQGEDNQTLAAIFPSNSGGLAAAGAGAGFAPRSTLPPESAPPSALVSEAAPQTAAAGAGQSQGLAPWFGPSSVLQPHLFDVSALGAAIDAAAAHALPRAQGPPPPHPQQHAQLQGLPHLAHDEALTSQFIAEHSELYSEQLHGDPLATVEGCFPPEHIHPRARVLELVSVLSRLHSEVVDRLHIFNVRTQPYYRSLDGRSDVDIAEMLALVGYFVLPKSLEAAIRLESTIDACKRQYIEEFASYNPDTATERKPRLLCFLAANATVRALIERGLQVLQHAFGDFTDTEDYYTNMLSSLVLYNFTEHYNRHQYWDGPEPRPALFDGLFGEPISEYGYRPGANRLTWYAAMCVVMERPIPWEQFASRDEPTKWRMYGSMFDHVNPLTAAVKLRRLLALQDIMAHGVNHNDPFTCGCICDTFSGHEDITRGFISAAPAAADVLSFHANFHKDFWSYWRTLETFCRCCTPETFCWLTTNLQLDWQPPHNSQQTEQLSHCAAHSGDLTLIQRLHALGVPLPWDFLSHACSRHEADMVTWGLDRGAVWHTSALVEAAKHGDKEFLLWVLSKGCPSASSMSGNVIPRLPAAVHVDLELLETLRSGGCEFDEASLTVVAKAGASEGRVDILEWTTCFPSARSLYALDSKNFMSVVLSTIVSKRRVCFEWLLTRGENSRPTVSTSSSSFRRQAFFVPEPFFWKEAPDRGMLDRLASLYDLSEFYGASLLQRDLEFARWLLAHGCSPSPAFVKAVCGVGNVALPLLQFCVEEAKLDLASFRDYHFCSAAAEGGSVATLEYLLSHGCQKRERDEIYAAIKGQIPMLRRLRSRKHKSDWPDDIIAIARDWDAGEAIQWAEKHGAPRRGTGDEWMLWLARGI